MRERAMAATGCWLSARCWLAAPATSGVNTQDLTTRDGIDNGLSSRPRRVVSTSSPPAASRVAPAPASRGVDARLWHRGALSAKSRRIEQRSRAQWNKFWEVYPALPHTPEGIARHWPRRSQSTPRCPTSSPTPSTMNSKGWDTYGEFSHRISWPQPVNGKTTAVIADCQDASQAGSLKPAPATRRQSVSNGIRCREPSSVGRTVSGELIRCST